MAKTTLNNVRIQLRNDTAANWVKSTVVLLAGEFAVENDTGLFKIGNGTDVFSALPYANNAAEVAQEFNALKDKIGEIPDDKTIIEMIQEAAASGSPYDDTEIKSRITANEEAITTLNGDGEGSVRKAITDATVNPLSITGAAVGQVAKIKTVDADGKPVEWEAADAPSGEKGLDGKDALFISLQKFGNRPTTDMAYAIKPSTFSRPASVGEKANIIVTNAENAEETWTYLCEGVIDRVGGDSYAVTFTSVIDITPSTTAGSGAVDSVNGKTGAVTLAALDVITSSSDMNKVSINSDNTLEVNTISFDKIVQQDTDEIIISGGNA